MNTIEIFRIFGSVFLKSDEADQSLDKIDKKAEGVGNKFTAMIGTAAKVGTAVVAGVTVAGGALLKLSTDAAGTADRVDKLSQKIGLSRQGFQEWDYVLGQSGVNIDVLQGGFKAFTNQIDEASKGTEKSAGYFKELGISLTDNAGKLKTQEQLFNETVKALQGMEEGPRKAALANDVLGKSASELAPVLNGTSGDVETLTKRAHDLGLVLGDDAVNAGVLLGDTIDDVKKTFGAFMTQIGVGVMPMIQSFLDWVLLHMPEIQSVFSVVFSAIETVVKVAFDIFNQYFLPIIQAVFKFIKDNFPGMRDFAVHAFTEIWKIVERLWKLFADNLLPILKALFDFIKPTFPYIADIVKGAFDIIITIANGVITVFETLFGWVRKVIDALSEFASAAGSVQAPDNVMGMDPNYGMSYYASGTTNARRGWAWVGEAGPELVNFGGGETVLSNRDSMRAGGGLTINIINEGTVIGTNGMEEFADTVSSKIANKYGLAVGGAW